MNDNTSRPALASWVLLPGVILSVGWGLRGFIDGSSLGAMIPGALIALALCFLVGESGRRAAQVAAFGAISVGFGGQETYGQTVQFVSRPEMFHTGFAGPVVSVTGAALLAAILVAACLAWQVALTVTIAAFVQDVTGFFGEWHPSWVILRWSLLVGVPVAAAWRLAVLQRRPPRQCGAACFCCCGLPWPRPSHGPCTTFRSR